MNNTLLYVLFYVVFLITFMPFTVRFWDLRYGNDGTSFRVAVLSFGGLFLIAAYIIAVFLFNQYMRFGEFQSRIAEAVSEVL